MGESAAFDVDAAGEWCDLRAAMTENGSDESFGDDSSKGGIRAGIIGAVTEEEE